MRSVKEALAPSGDGLSQKTTPNVALSKDGAFKQTIVLPPAIEALFGMTSDERFAEVKRICQRDEVEALRAYVLPLTTWMNDIGYLLENYSEVVDALENHFNKTGRPEAARATWGDLSLDTQTLKYIGEKFGYKTDSPITWAGICHVFFNKSIRTMQRTKSYQAMLSSGETILPHKKRRGKRPVSKPTETADDAETEALARLAIEWASQNPDHDKAQAIMKVAIDRASRLGQNIPSFETKPTTGMHLVEDAPTKDTAAELKIALANEPDRDVASKMLTEHLSAYAEQFGDGRITIKEVTAKIGFVGRDHRIMPGDWLEKRNGNEAPTLCTCVGVAEFMQRRKIKEWKDGGWSKERVIFNAGEDDYRVVTPEVARSLAPQAFPKPPSSEGL